MAKMMSGASHAVACKPTGKTIVIDLGKTLTKVSLWDDHGRMIDRQVRANVPQELDGARRLDVMGIGRWLIEAMAAYREHPVRTIIPVGHGAAIVALAHGELAFPPLDYEQPIPDAALAAYRAQRDPFETTGSPALPDGLNLGSQIWWMQHLHPDAMAQAILLPWPQYWAWFLTGRAVSEVTSLGCHSDLWSPHCADFSPMAKRLGWADRFAPLANAGCAIGTITPRIAAATGLSAAVEVLAGLHDSNAALLAARGFADIADHEATVLSTGTWFVAMRLPAVPVTVADLAPARDCLVNVDVQGRAVPSTRFMGGREIETLIEIDTRRVDITPDQPLLLAAVPQVLHHRRMILPTLASGTGPFPEGRFAWVNPADDWYERRAAACLYAALVADTALDLIGSERRLLVEGRFAEAQVFVRALAALRPETTVYTANAHNDVSFGALRLRDPALVPAGQLVPVKPLAGDLDTYRDHWLAQMASNSRRHPA